MLSKVKLLLGITGTDKDDILMLLIDKATEEVINYTKDPQCVSGISGCIVDMVVYNYNRLGTEGINSEGYSGVSFSYSADYPESIMRTLRAHRKVLFK